MKVKLSIFFLAGWLCMPINIFARNTTFDVSADLDGDGRPEAIHLSIKPSGAYELTVGQSSAHGRLPDPKSLCDEAQYQLNIIDIDQRDSYKEIEIFMSSGIDSCMDYTYHFYDYAGASLKQMWTLQSKIPEFSGNGIVLAKDWRGFWSKTEKYVLDSQGRAMDFVAQPFYYVGLEVRVNQSIPIYLTPKGQKTVAHLRQDSACLILLYDASTGWYLIKSTTGLVGWTREIGKLALPSAG